MSLTRRRIQKEIEQTIRALQACGCEIGGVERTGDGGYRVLTKGEAKADAFEVWSQKRGLNHANQGG